MNNNKINKISFNDLLLALAIGGIKIINNNMERKLLELKQVEEEQKQREKLRKNSIDVEFRVINIDKI